MTERGVERRKVERTEVVASVDCEAHGRSERAIAFDLSTNGCLLQCSLTFLDVGDAVGLRFPGGLVRQGEVRWRQELNTGVRFSGSFPAAAIQHHTLSDLPAPSTVVRSDHQSKRFRSEFAMPSPARSFDPPLGRGGSRPSSS